MHILELENPAFDAELQLIASKLKSSKKIVFVAGAGISCNAGIPDFRSKDGLYSLVKKSFPNTVVKGQDLFDINIFRKSQTTEIFYSFMAGLRTATYNAHATPTHHFLKLLKDKKKLLRCYTQNIDGLEYRVGLTETDAVQLHGDLHKLRCNNCSQQFEWTDTYYQNMLDGSAPDCLNCSDQSLARTVSGKRRTTVGQLRPDIILYGQDHPNGDSIASIASKDSKKTPNMLIVAGTSLKVLGIKRLVKDLATAVHSGGGITVFVNKTKISKSEWNKVFDYQVLGDSDTWVNALKKNIPSLFQVQTKIKVEKKRKSTNTEHNEVKSEENNSNDSHESIPVRETIIVKHEPISLDPSTKVVDIKHEQDVAVSAPHIHSTIDRIPAAGRELSMQLSGRTPGIILAKRTKSEPFDFKSDELNSPCTPKLDALSQTSISEHTLEHTAKPEHSVEFSADLSRRLMPVPWDSFSDPLTDPLTDPLSDQLTDSLTDTDEMPPGIKLESSQLQ